MRKRKEEIPVEVTVPITPMLDMSFQLLSFFIITFRAPSQEGQLSIDLPRLDASNSQQIPNETPDIKDEYTIIVHGDVEIRSLSIKGAAYPEKDLRNSAALYDILKTIAGSKPAGQAGKLISITIEADERLVYGKLIEVMDHCKKAGMESMNLMPVKVR